VLSALEFENGKKLLEDIISIRTRKIILAALRTVRGAAPPEQLTEKEAEFFDRMVTEFKSFMESMKVSACGPDGVVEEKIEAVKKLKEEKEEKNINNVKIRILKEVPEFVDSDLRKHGPYTPGETIETTPEVANLLVMRKLAERVEK